MVLTEVHLRPEGDAHFPVFDRDEWVETRRVPGPGLEWVWWERAAHRSLSERSAASPGRGDDAGDAGNR
jgi:hypothetical protein